MSVLVFAGASQLAALDLLGRDAALGVVVVTAVVVNLRPLMYSASIAPHFRDLPTRTRAACAYLLTDPSYAMSVARYAADERGGGDRTRRPYYYLGVGGTLWVTWQAGTAAGVAFGAAVPDGRRLEFAVPPVFLALLVPTLSDRPRLVGGAAAGLAAWRTGSVVWTIAAGMTGLHAARFLL